MNAEPDNHERRSRDTRPQPARRNAAPVPKRRFPGGGPLLAAALLAVLVLAAGAGAGCVLMANLGIVRLDSPRLLSIRRRVRDGNPSVLSSIRKDDVNYVFDDGTTLLFDGVASQNSNIVASLVARGANVNKRAEGPRYSEFDRFDMSFAGWTPLMLAVSKSAPSCWATEKASAEPDAANARAIVRILLDHRADPSAMIGDRTFPITPLSLALQKEDSYSYPLLDELLAAGADPDPIVWGTNTVLDLMTAHCNGLKEVVGVGPGITAELLERYERRILYLRAAATNAP
jgi:hypothetical protein